MSSAYLELKDLSSDLEIMSDKVVVDEKRIDEINARLSVFQRLLKKHGVVSEALLLEKRNELSVKVAAFEGAQEELVSKEKEKKILFDTALKIATSVHEKRKTHAPILEAASIELLSRIGMPNARLKIAIDKEELNASGIDQPLFLFDANKSGQFEPLQKVASGGELSRLMLVLKSLVAGSLEMPTLIFDEIDSGISGEAARQVGILLEELADAHQLISITHQPQIAARADHHLYVYKEDKNGTINTSIKLLSHEERVSAIAKMLAGENPSEAALANAREMMN
jgi:DNA repair protein RecN (Recombination protein N)